MIEASARQLPDWLSRRAADAPDRPAIVAGERQWRFATLDTAAQMLAMRLAARGIGPGDRVAALLTNGPPYVVLVHALTRLGAVLVGLNTRLAAPELAWQIARTRARLLVHDPLTASLAQAACAATAPDHAAPPLCALARTAALDDLLPGGTPAAAKDTGVSSPLRTHIDLAAVQSIMFTSGTTGRPKGALLTYGNHWWSAIASALNLGLHADDRWLVCLPLFHVGGLAILFRSVIYGMPIVFPDAHPHVGPRPHTQRVPGEERTARSFDPAGVNQAIAAHGVTLISVVSAQLQRMLDAESSDPSSASGASGAWRTLRCVLLGGGPAPRPLLEACAARGIAVAQSYGLTETASQAVTLAPADALRKLGSAGRPLLPTDLRIAADGGTITTETQRHGESTETTESLHTPPVARDDDSHGANPTAVGGRCHDATPPSGGLSGPDVAEDISGFSVGEILVRGPTVTPGYLPTDGDLAAPVPATDVEGWLHTGDVGYLDAEGYLYVLDRRDDLIISGGENVYPAEVESVLLGHPGVAEAGVFGVPDPRWGQTVAAAVVRRPGADVSEEEILAFCRARLAGYKAPRQIRFVEALPRNAAGKLLRRLLREQDSAFP